MTSNIRSGRLVTRFAVAVFAAGVSTGTLCAQGITQPSKAQVVASEAYDNRRIQDGMEKDKAAARSKEERMAVVNEAFKRLQLLHNEMMAMMSSDEGVENARIAGVIDEVRMRASQLNANLALPELPKSKSEKSAPAGDPPIMELMAAVCADIRAFVKDVNLSPADPKAGLQARRDLLGVMDKSDRILLKLSTLVKS